MGEQALLASTTTRKYHETHTFFFLGNHTMLTGWEHGKTTGKKRAATSTISTEQNRTKRIRLNEGRGGLNLHMYFGDCHDFSELHRD